MFRAISPYVMRRETAHLENRSILNANFVPVPVRNPKAGRQNEPFCFIFFHILIANFRNADSQVSYICMTKINFKKIFNKKERERIELTDDDKELLLFIARHKFIDDVAGRIVLSKKNDRAFWRRINKLKQYGYARTHFAALQSVRFGTRQKNVTVIALDSAGCTLTNTKKISKLASNLKHNLYVKRVCAALLRLIGQGFEYDTESIMEYDEKNKYVHIPDPQERYNIRPDIFVKDYQIAFEIELNIKDKYDYEKRLFWFQFVKNLNKTIWLVETENDKRKLINIFKNCAGIWFQTDKYGTKKLIDDNVIDKNFVMTMDDFLSNYEQTILRITGLS